MVGIVVVSHSQKLAEAVVELAHMVAKDADICAAGGMDDGGLGTSYNKIEAAIEEVMSDDGVIVLMDMGSSVMTTELVLEDLEDDRVQMVDCPVVEGAVAAAVLAAGGLPVDMVVAAAKEAGDTPKF